MAKAYNRFKQYSYFIVIIIYLIGIGFSTICPGIAENITNNIIIDEINTKKENVIVVLLPLITMIIVFYTSEYKALTKTFGFKIVKKIFPYKQANINIHFIIFSIVSIIISIFDLPILLLLYLLNSALIAYYIVFSIRKMKDNIIENYINVRHRIGTEQIMECKQTKENKMFYSIGAKCLNLNQEELLLSCIKHMISLIDLSIEMKNKYLSNGLKMEEYIDYIISNYSMVIELTNHVVNSKRDYLRNKLIRELSSPIVKCAKFEEYSLMESMLVELYQSFINKDYLRTGSTDESFVVDLIGYMYNEISENDIKNELKNIVVESINRLILMIALSNESSIKTSIFALVNRIFRSNEGQKPDFNQTLIDLFFNHAETSIKQNTSEVSFSFILFRSYLRELKDKNDIAVIKIAVERFLNFNKFCLFNKVSHSYHENLIIFEDAVNFFYKYKETEEIIDKHFEFLMFNINLSELDSTLEYNIINLYQINYIDKLNSEDYNKSLNRVIIDSIRKSNKRMLFLVLSEHNNKLKNIDKQNKSKQEDFLKLYYSILENAINSSNKEVFLLVFQLFEDVLIELDKTDNMSLSLYTDTLRKLVDTSKLCLGINDTENCNLIIDMMFHKYYKFSHSEKTCNAELLICSLEAIGINAIEYENKIITKAVSNVIGWLTVRYCFEKGMSELFSHNIEKLITMFNLSLTAFNDTMTSTFIGTAFIILGGFTESELKFQRYNKNLLEKIKELKNIELLNASYQFRLDYSSSTSDNLEVNKEHIKKFFIKLKKVVS